MLFTRLRSAVKKSFRKVFPKFPSPAPATENINNESIDSVSTNASVPPFVSKDVTRKYPLRVPAAEQNVATSKPIAASLVSEPPIAAVVPEQRKYFKKTVMNEMMLFKQNTNHFVLHTKKISNTWLEWLGMGTISSAVAFVNIGVALVSAFGLMIAPVSAGIALGASLLGITAGVAFNVYLYKMRQKEHARADAFMDCENLEGNLAQLAETLMTVLSEQLEDCTRYDAEMLAKASCTAISYAIMKGKVKSFDELRTPSSLRAVLAGFASYAPDYKLHRHSKNDAGLDTRKILENLFERKRKAIRPGVRSAMTNIKPTAADYADQEPLLSRTATQTMFSPNASKASLRYALAMPAGPSPRRKP